MWRHRPAPGLLLAILLVPALAFARQDDRDREKNERVADILVEIGAREGAHIADLGSADGFYTLRIAKAVAPAGRAYAVDIDAKLLDRLRSGAQEEQVANIDIIMGEPADPKLPAGQLDAVLIRNAYHEMSEHRRILASVAAALKPGGVFVVIEAIHDKNRSLNREQQVKEHELAPEIVEAELREAGFEILKRDDGFTTFTRGAGGGFWLIKARRP